MQSEILEWFADNLAVTMGLIMLVVILIVFFYIKRYIRIFPPDWHVIHYRRGKLLKQYKNGGMVVMIPFFDVLKAKPGPVEAEPPEFLDDFSEWASKQSGKE